MFIASLFTIAKMWKQPERPSVDEWIKKKKMQYMHTMKCYPVFTMNELGRHYAK